MNHCDFLEKLKLIRLHPEDYFLRVPGTHYYAVAILASKIGWRKTQTGYELSFSCNHEAPLSWRTVPFQEVFENAPDDIKDLFIFDLDELIKRSDKR